MKAPDVCVEHRWVVRRPSRPGPAAAQGGARAEAGHGTLLQARQPFFELFEPQLQDSCTAVVVVLVSVLLLLAGDVQTPI